VFWLPRADGCSLELIEEALAELALGAPIVNPRLGADAAADPAVWLPFLRKGFSFFHQLTFSAGWDVAGVVAGMTAAGCTGSGMLAICPPICSSGVQLLCDWRVWPFGPVNDRSIVPLVPSHERTCVWLIVRPPGSVWLCSRV
jgi:hypothetical protein